MKHLWKARTRIILAAIISLCVMACMLPNTVLAAASATGIYAGRYSVNQVFDCQRTPAYPIEQGATFKVAGFAPPYDAVASANKQFKAEDIQNKIFYFVDTEDQNSPFSLCMADDVNGTNQYTVSVKGKIYGLGAEGFLYVDDAEGYGYFIANECAYNYGDSLTYVPHTVGPITKEEGENYTDVNQTPQKILDPVFSPATGTSVTASDLITITSATEGATIYYTLDGTTPTTASAKYTAPFPITADQATVKAIAVKGEQISEVVTATYVIGHTHAWATAWSGNETHHWHECTASGCTITENADKDGYAVHTAKGEASAAAAEKATCDVCGREYKNSLQSPTTGDTCNATLWAAALLVSGILLVGVAAFSRKKKIN